MANPGHTITIPQSFLLILAVHGNMGEGEVPSIMQVWAQKECARLGLMPEVTRLQHEHLAELKQRLTNVLGADAVGWMQSEIDKATDKLRS